MLGVIFFATSLAYRAPLRFKKIMQIPSSNGAENGACSAVEKKLKNARERIEELEAQVKSLKAHAPLNTQAENIKGAYHSSTIEALAGKPVPMMGHKLGVFHDNLDLKNRLKSKMTIVGRSPGISDGNFSECTHLDFLFRPKKDNERRCLAMFDTNDNWSLGGFLMSYPVNKSAGFPDGLPIAADVPDQQLVTREYPRFYTSFIRERDKVLQPFYAAKNKMKEGVIQLLKKKGGFPKLDDRGPVDDIDGHPPCLVMCVNDGHLPMIWNFLCGLKRRNLEMPKHIIYVTSPDLVERLTALGLVVGKINHFFGGTS